MIKEYKDYIEISDISNLGVTKRDIKQLKTIENLLCSHKPKNFESCVFGVLPSEFFNAYCYGPNTFTDCYFTGDFIGAITNCTFKGCGGFDRMHRASIRNAKFIKTSLNPLSMLQCSWFRVSNPSLIDKLMRFDAANHPNPKAFDLWKEGGPCPYSCLNVKRAVAFYQNEEFYTKGPALSAYKLMMLLFKDQNIEFNPNR